MKCSKCGAEFQGKFCPNCGTPAEAQVQQPAPPVQPEKPAAPQTQTVQNPQQMKKRGGCLKGGLITVGVVIVICIIVSAIGGKNNSASTNTAASQAAVSSTTAATSITPSAAASSVPASSAEETATYGIGQTAVSNEVKMTLVSAKKSTGSEYNKPESGKVFVLCEFNIENNSKSDLAISSVASFEAYVDSYSVNESLTGLIEKGNKNQLDGNIAAGKKMDGVIAYEVPKDWKALEIRLNPQIFSFFSKQTVFKVTNK